MATTSRSAWFVIGAASAWALPWALDILKEQLRRRQDERKRRSDEHNIVIESSATSTEMTSAINKNNTMTPKIMDAADLDLRMIRKAEGVIRYRTSGITVVIERCSNDWNYSAILRTAEALGVQNVYIVDPPTMTMDIDVDNDAEECTAASASDKKIHPKQAKVALTKEEVANRRAHHLFAQNATDWLTITNFDSTQECIDKLKATGHAIWATDLSQEAVPLTVPDLVEANSWPVFPNKIALVFGTEAVGVTQLFLDQADLRVYLPLYGFADSLNLSVATALVVFAVLQMEPRYVGHMSEEERRELRSIWFPKLAQQRLLTGSQKKKRHKLLARIDNCKVLEEKRRRYEQQQHQQAGISGDEDTLRPLTYEQVVKLGQLSQLQHELHELEQSARFHEGSFQAVADLIDNPPDPMTDLRRIDEHRICFVGKNTKSIYKDAWKGLAATTTKATDTSSTAAYFRSRAKINGDN
ncbi:hypothetical protein MPSEU_000740000 [Mayamaea pseudoterrestris]|nr:hypothetical protein MPSEU_000740000 [Mayamaea pseudoterrestris]